jgi:hypothetical protein
LKGFLGELDPAECKLHCAVWNRHEQPIDVLARSWNAWVGWNSWRPTHNAFNRRFIFSLAQMVYDHPTHWLFGGVFEVLGRRPEPRTVSYDVEWREDFLGAHVKRLVVGFEMPGRNNRLEMKRWLNKMEVLAILPEPYAGEPFPGLDQINHTLSQLEVVFEQQRADWRYALEPMKGVYVVHDKSTGKPYIGSAYGDTGIWQRWGSYVDSLHGGNVLLRELVGRKGEAYARENLVFALLEYWPTREPDALVRKREEYWKQVLLSRGKFGLNKN